MTKTKLEKNLSHVGNEFAEKIRAAEPPKWYSPTKAKNGDKAFSVIKGGKVAEPFNQNAPRFFGKEVAKNYALAKTEALVLIGAGVGHVINQVFKKAEKGFVLIVAEPNYYLIREALSHYDFSRHLKEHKLFFCATKEIVAGSISHVESVDVVENWSMVINPYCVMVPETYGEYIEHSGNVLNTIACNTGTMMGAGQQIAHNDLSNLPYLIQYPGVNELKNSRKGGTAVIVSTGPSLEKNIQLLLKPDYRDKITVICVAQAARALLAYGVTPDYMCTVDYGEVNASHFSGLEECGVPLIALNRTYAPIFETWKSPVYVVTSLREQRNAITDVWLDRGCLEQGGSVSHFSVGLAIHLGCKNIALIGQDLAYENNLSHIPLADSSGSLKIEEGQIDWQIDDPRSPIYKKDYKMGPPIPVEGYWGEDVTTNMGLASFIQTFEILGNAYKKQCRFFNCTEGGARIPAFRSTTLKSFFIRFAKKNILPHLSPAEEQEISLYKEGWEQDIKIALRFCEMDVKNLKTVRDESENGLEEITKAESYIGDKDRKSNPEWLAAIAENKKSSDLAHVGAKKNPLLEAAIFKASREIAGKDLFVSSKHMGTDDDILATRVKRNRTILNAAKKEAEKLLEIYSDVEKKLLSLLEDPQALRSKTPPAPSIADAEEYLEKGNWALPILEIRRMDLVETAIEEPNRTGLMFRCLGLREKALARGDVWQEGQLEREKLLRKNALVREARVVGSRDKNWRKSYLYLKYANKLFPDDSQIWYGLASAALLNKRYKESEAVYKKLVEKDPNNIHTQYEYSLCLLNVGEMVKGFSKLKSVMEKTEQFDDILFSVAETFRLQNTPEADEKSVAILEEYLKKFPRNPEAWKAMAEWTEGKEREIALKQYKKLSR